MGRVGDEGRLGRVLGGGDAGTCSDASRENVGVVGVVSSEQVQAIRLVVID